MTTTDDLNRIGEVFFAICKAVDSPISLGAWLRFKYREHAQLASMQLSPDWYCSPFTFKQDYLVVEYLSKYKGLDLDIDTAEVAYQKFTTSEDQCRRTNYSLYGPWLQGISPVVASVLYTARRKIAAVLGDYSDVWLDHCKWGPGATFTLKGGEATVDNKIGENPICITHSAVELFNKAISTDYHWLSSLGIVADGPVSLVDSNFVLSPGCRVTTVPKSAKTDRVIAIEPTANTFLQGGVGAYIRRRLRRVGIDLNDQTVNQKFAQDAVRMAYATVDLSAASDTISKQLIVELLPPEWAEVIFALRSPYAKMPNGSWVELEKVSSMGNGFTFELETLIFWALTKSVCECEGLASARVITYGDDIICPSEVMPALLEVFTFCGFSINTEKTHWRTLFRESCGKHYFDGIDVTPIYQKEITSEELSEAYRAANRLRRLALSWGGYHLCDSILRNAWLAAVRVNGLWPRPRHAVPLDSEDDDGLALPWEELRQFTVGRSPYGGFKFNVLSFKSVKRSSLNEMALLAYELRFSGEAIEPDRPREHEASLRAYATRLSPSSPFNGKVVVRRRGKYVTRRRSYESCVDAPWDN